MRPKKRAVVFPHAFGLRSIVAGWTWCAFTRGRRGTTARASPPRRALRLHDHQRAPRKLSVHEVALCSPCAYHAPHYTAQALRAETAAYATLARLSTRITLDKRTCSRILRIMSPTILPRCHARRPRRTLRSHHCQRASRKQSVHAAVLSSPCANRVSHYTSQKRKKG